MPDKSHIYTIGFTKTTARSFFDRLKTSGVKTILDVRLHNISQLSGFAKAKDLEYFLDQIAGIEYKHVPMLAPEDAFLKAYKRDGGSWQIYESHFMELMKERQIEKRLDPAALSESCLLCSEATPHHCHRRLVCDYLNRAWGGTMTVTHL